MRRAYRGAGGLVVGLEEQLDVQTVGGIVKLRQRAQRCGDHLGFAICRDHHRVNRQRDVGYRARFCIRDIDRFGREGEAAEDGDVVDEEHRVDGRDATGEDDTGGERCEDQSQSACSGHSNDHQHL